MSASKAFDSKSLAATMRAIFESNISINHEQLVALRELAQKAYNQGGVVYVGSAAMVMHQMFAAGSTLESVLAVRANVLNKAARKFEKDTYKELRRRGNPRIAH